MEFLVGKHTLPVDVGGYFCLKIDSSVEQYSAKRISNLEVHVEIGSEPPKVLVACPQIELVCLMGGYISSKLDIDFPYEVVKKENLMSKPEKVEYKLDHIRYRHYGKLIELMIDEACKYPEGAERDALVSLIANHMKKLIFSINKEGVEDEKILKDLYHYSHGKINLDAATYKLREFKEAPVAAPATSSKKKKKK